jgi:hypothetical protein
MTSIARPSLHLHERMPHVCSLDPSAPQYHKYPRPAGQLLLHPTTARQSDARDWTVRQRRPEGALTLPPLSVWHPASNSHTPSSEPTDTSYQIHRQPDFLRHQPGSQLPHVSRPPSYTDHSRPLHRHPEATYHSFVEHHPIVRSQRHPSYADDHSYSSPALDRAPSCTGVDETEGGGDMDVHLSTDPATLPSDLTAPPVSMITPSKERRPHKCPHEDCQMSFPRPSALRTHLNKHTGDKRTSGQELQGDR